MKITIKLFFVVIIFQYCASEDYKVKINGNIENHRNHKIYLKYDPTYLEKKYKILDSAFVDSNGNFAFNFEVIQPQWAKLVYGNEKIDVLLNPNDNFFIRFKADSLEETISFAGEDSIINEYLYEKTNVRFKFSLRHHNKKPTLFINHEDSLKQKKQAYLNNYFKDLKNKNTYVELFLKNEIQSIYYDWLNARVIYSTWHRLYDINFKPDSSYFSFIKKIDYENDSLLENPSYRSFVMNFMWSKANAIRGKDTTKPLERPRAILKMITDVFEGQTQQLMLTDMLLSSIMGNGIYYKLDRKTRSAFYKEHLVRITNEEYKQFLQAYYLRMSKLVAGTPAPLFTLNDVSGNSVSLEDFIGNVIYLDFWASWCVPCLKEMPNSKKLQEYFEGQPVKFIYISTDKDSIKWQSAIKKNKLEGIQLLASTKTKQAYNITSIPHYVLIDKQGKIVDYNAERPSGNIKREIELLLSE